MAGEGEASTRYTTDDALSRVGFGRFQALVLAYSGLGWVAEAFEIMLLSFVGPAVEAEWGVSGAEKGLISSVVFTGMLMGSIAGGLIADRCGRRIGFLFTAAVTGIFGLLSAFSPNYASLLALRFLDGLGLGGGHVLSTWFIEFVPAAKRGTWMVVYHCCWTVGTILEALLAWCASVGTYLVQPKDANLYRNVLVTSLAEFPGLVLAALIVDRIGRKVSMGGLLLLCGAFLAPLSVHLEEGLITTLLFCARTCIMGSFAVLYVYTPELYPASSRNTGVGITSSLGRIGSIVSPLVTVGLLESCRLKEAVFVMDLVLVLGGVACAFFPLETNGCQIQ